MLPHQLQVLLLIVVCRVHCNVPITVMYAHDKSSDYIAEQCLNEMFPKAKINKIEETDESCIIFCILNKFGIISDTGSIDLEVYRKRVEKAHHFHSKNLGTDLGENCLEKAGNIEHRQDVCKKAKVFNDCTHLYMIMFSQ